MRNFGALQITDTQSLPGLSYVVIRQPPPFPKEAFGHAFAAARRATGMTLDEIAERSGLSRRYLIDVEHAKKIPSIRTLFLLAGALGIPLDRLFRDVETPDSSTPLVVRRIVRVLERERVASQDEAEQYRRAPQPGSPFLADDDRWRRVTPNDPAGQRGRLWHDVLVFMDETTGSALGHLQAAQRLLEAPDTIPLAAHAALSQATCEAAATVAHVLEPGIDADLRLLRGVALLLDEAALRENVTRMLPVSRKVAADLLRDANDRVTTLLDRMAEAGIKTVGEPPRLCFTDDGSATARDVDVSQLVATVFPDRPDLRRSASVASHGRAALSAVGGISVHDVVQPNVNESVLGIAGVVGTCITAGGVLTSAYGAYFGHDLGAAAESRAARARAVRSLTNRWLNRPQAVHQSGPA
ncbi:helix-turn-helix domain-containing protein [Actinoplanes sp. NPDC024001]|uniref:helix-turn-helix domain-containing protein n=1 Tax=unclassified Actinoplanes TaxID=2626549 RepID=UPI002E1B4128